jgi:hypothetical protein
MERTKGMTVVAVPKRELELFQALGRTQGLDDLVHHVRRHARDHLVVDKQRRRLIAHANARRVFEGKQPVGRGLAEVDAQLGAEGRRDAIHALDLVDDVVAQADHESPARLTREEGVERRRAFDLDPADR